MKARREIGGTAYRLFEGDREIGFIRGGTVGFTGFVNAEEAALAGRVAHLALVARRNKQRPWTPSLPPDHRILTDQDGRRLVVAPEGILATLTPPPAGGSRFSRSPAPGRCGPRCSASASPGVCGNSPR